MVGLHARSDRGGLFVDESLITAEVSRPMEVEPYLERWRSVGRLDGASDGRAPLRILTEADYTRFLDDFVAALVRPVEAS